MEPGKRLEALQHTQILRAELHEVRLTLRTLQESAWAEDADRSGSACSDIPGKVTVLADTVEAASLSKLKLLNAPLAANSSGTLEDAVGELIEQGRILACCGSDGFDGFCAVAANATSADSGDQAATALVGEVNIFAVQPHLAERESHVVSQLLVAAEEHLAANYQCGEVRVTCEADCLQQVLERFGYKSLDESSVNTKVLSKQLAVGFISRSLARKMASREISLVAELTRVEESLCSVDPLRVGLSSSMSSTKREGSRSESCADLLSPLPHDVVAAILRSFCARELCMTAVTCRILAQEASDGDLWREMFIRSCWPANETLLVFAEESAASPGGVDWRCRMRSRAAAPPAIVVDVGRGYTKYGVVHGLDGRPEGDGDGPRIVQLCSSPTHPPDCDHGEQIGFIHRELDKQLLLGAHDREHPFHRAAVCGSPPLTTGGHALLCNFDSQPELNGLLVKVQHFDPDSGRWRVVQCFPNNAFVSPSAVVSNPFASHPGSAGQEDRSWFEEDTDLADSPDFPPTFRVLPRCLRAIRRASDLPLLIGEPFAATADAARRRANVRHGSWTLAMETDLRTRPGPVRIVPQAQMALWAHGIDHGIVVNIGQGQMIALPVVCGEIAASAACCSNMGSSTLTQLMMQMLSTRFRGGSVDSRLMTWCRDLKENYCYVAPPAPVQQGKHGGCAEPVSLRRRLSLGDEFGVQRVRVESPFAGMADIELGVERVLVPESLFDSALCRGEMTLPELIIRCAERVLQLSICSQEALQALLRNIVLVGGAADLPGMRPRTEFEVRNLLYRRASLRGIIRSPEDAFVLNPPLSGKNPLTSPRFVPFIGGCVRMASSGFLNTSSALNPEGDHLPEERPTRNMSGINAWVRRRLVNLNAPAIFRAGGGGGEDEVWGALGWAPMQDLEVDTDPSSSSESMQDPDAIFDHLETDSDENDDDMAEEFPLQPPRSLPTRPPPSLRRDESDDERAVQSE